MDSPRKSSETSRFSLGEIGMKVEDIPGPELQSIRELSYTKRGSIISEISNISIFMKARNDVIEHYGEYYENEPPPQPHKNVRSSCCTIN